MQEYILKENPSFEKMKMFGLPLIFFKKGRNLGYSEALTTEVNRANIKTLKYSLFDSRVHLNKKLFC